MNTVFQKIKATLLAQNFKYVDSPDQIYAFEGAINVAGQTANLRIEISDFNFLKLPEIILLNPEILPRDRHLVHMLDRNAVCYFDRATIEFDPHTPVENILLCLQSAKDVLINIIEHRNVQQDLEREFSSYWQGLALYIDTSASDLKTYYYGNEEKAFLILATDNKKLIDEISKVKGLEPHKLIPSKVLTTTSILTFPQEMRAPQTFGELKAWIDKIDSKINQEILATLVEHSGKVVVFIKALNAICGFLIENFGQFSQAISKGTGGFRGVDLIFSSPQASNFNISRYVGKSINSLDVAKRNLPKMKTLQDINITIIGCGTIGSHLSKFLLQTGAGLGKKGNLNLIDHDILQPGNIGRHLLGYNYLGTNKAISCAEELRRYYPTSNIKSFSTDAMETILVLEKSDFVINATGNETFSNAINKLALERRKQSGFPWILHTMLFGYGDATQSIIEGDKDFACYRCLKVNGKWRDWPLKESADKFEFEPATCSDTAYAAYSVAAPVIAAGIALDLTLDWVNDKAKASSYFRARQIDTKNSNYIKDRNILKTPNCPACKNA